MIEQASSNAVVSGRRGSLAVEAGNTVIVVEQDMQVIARCDWLIDMGPSAGDEGGYVIATGTPAQVARSRSSRTAKYLRQAMAAG